MRGFLLLAFALFSVFALATVSVQADETTDLLALLSALAGDSKQPASSGTQSELAGLISELGKEVSSNDEIPSSQDDEMDADDALDLVSTVIDSEDEEVQESFPEEADEEDFLSEESLSEEQEDADVLSMPEDSELSEDSVVEDVSENLAEAADAEVDEAEEGASLLSEETDTEKVLKDLIQSLEQNKEIDNVEVEKQLSDISESFD